MKPGGCNEKPEAQVWKTPGEAVYKCGVNCGMEWQAQAIPYLRQTRWGGKLPTL